MTTQTPMKVAYAARHALAQPGSLSRWPVAVVTTARPRQWPKNLLVFAAPLAAASLGRDDGLGYALVSAAAFLCASAAVYFVNDVADAERDRRHPVKRDRPVAAGDLPKSHAITLAAVCVAAAMTAGFAIEEPLLIMAAVPATWACHSFTRWCSSTSRSSSWCSWRPVSC